MFKNCYAIRIMNLNRYYLIVMLIYKFYNVNSVGHKFTSFKREYVVRRRPHGFVDQLTCSYQLAFRNHLLQYSQLERVDTNCTLNH